MLINHNKTKQSDKSSQIERIMGSLAFWFISILVFPLGIFKFADPIAEEEGGETCQK